MRKINYMLNEKIKQDIKVILDYLWLDEKRNYQESEYRKNIFLEL